MSEQAWEGVTVMVLGLSHLVAAFMLENVNEEMSSAQAEELDDEMATVTDLASSSSALSRTTS